MHKSQKQKKRLLLKNCQLQKTRQKTIEEKIHSIKKYPDIIGITMFVEKALVSTFESTDFEMF